jgi:hypothetical protein
VPKHGGGRKRKRKGRPRPAKLPLSYTGESDVETAATSSFEADSEVSKATGVVLRTGSVFIPGEDQTQAPEIASETIVEEAVVQTWPGLVEQVVTGRLLTYSALFVASFVVWVVALAWMFLQDNAAGKLEGWVGLEWLGVKATILTGFIVLANTVGGVFLGLRKWLKRQAS